MSKSFRLRVQNKTGMGKGLFLVEGTIPRESIVVELEQPVRLDQKEWDKNIRPDNTIKTNRKIFPSDIGLYLGKKYVYVDQKLIDNAKYNKTTKTMVHAGKSKRVPRWYRINHSPTPNLYLTWVKDSKSKKKRIVWKAKKRITFKNKPIHLCFKYDGVPESWNH